MNKELALSWLSNNVRSLSLVPKNASRYTPSFIGAYAARNTMGFRADQRIAEGLVIERVPEADCYLIKTGRTEFTFVDVAVLQENLQVGSKVKITPYQRREFNGYPLGEEPPRAEGGMMCRTLVIGKTESTLPFPKPKSYYLSNPSGLVALLERGKCTDGIRVISNMLVDCKATDFQIIDTHWDEERLTTDAERAEAARMTEDPDQLDPEISFHVTTGKFVGRVGIAVDLGSDSYTVKLREASIGTNSTSQEVLFVDLASVLEQLICDGEWKYAKVEVLSPAKKTKAVAELL